MTGGYRTARYRLNEKQAREHKAQVVDKIKLESGCVDCGYNEHACAIDFDHVRGVKSFGIGTGVSSRSMKSILKEIEKCEGVCANCHRVRTKQRRTNEETEAQAQTNSKATSTSFFAALAQASAGM